MEKNSNLKYPKNSPMKSLSPKFNFTTSVNFTKKASTFFAEPNIKSFECQKLEDHICTLIGLSHPVYQKLVYSHVGQMNGHL